jgi:hypothetical protein
MRIRTILAAAAAPAALAAVLLGSAGSAANAATLTAGSGNPNGVIAKMTGNNNPAVYVDPVFGPVKANETSHAANGGHAAFDTVGVTFTGGQVMTPGQSGDVAWYSDFQPGSSSPEAGHYGTLHYTVNADGTGYSGTATYPAS